MKRPRQYISTSEPVKFYFHFFGWSGNFLHEVQIAAASRKPVATNRRAMGLVEHDELERIHDCRQGRGRHSLRNSFDFA
jgi:hypothetical protein